MPEDGRSINTYEESMENSDQRNTGQDFTRGKGN